MQAFGVLQMVEIAAEALSTNKVGAAGRTGYNIMKGKGVLSCISLVW